MSQTRHSYSPNLDLLLSQIRAVRAVAAVSCLSTDGSKPRLYYTTLLHGQSAALTKRLTQALRWCTLSTGQPCPPKTC